MLTGGDLVECLVRSRTPAPRPRTRCRRSRTSRGNAERTGALAIAARCRGLMADDDALRGAFDEALRLHREVRRPSTRRAPTSASGERLRRAQRRSDARVHLRAALDRFEALGAVELGGHRSRRAGRQGRRPPPAQAPLGRPHPPGAPGGADGGLRRDEPRGGVAPVPLREDDRGEPRRIYRKSACARAELAALVAQEGLGADDVRSAAAGGAVEPAAAAGVRLDDVEPEVERVEVETSSSSFAWFPWPHVPARRVGELRLARHDPSTAPGTASPSRRHRRLGRRPCGSARRSPARSGRCHRHAEVEVELRPSRWRPSARSGGRPDSRRTGPASSRARCRGSRVRRRQLRHALAQLLGAGEVEVAPGPASAW